MFKIITRLPSVKLYDVSNRRREENVLYLYTWVEEKTLRESVDFKRPRKDEVPLFPPPSSVLFDSQIFQIPLS